MICSKRTILVKNPRPAQSRGTLVARQNRTTLKLTTTFLFLIIFKFSFGQYHFGHITDFTPLGITDTINTSKDIKNLIQIDSLNSNDYFFTNKYQGYNNLFLIKKVNTKWIVFNFEIGAYYGPNSSISKIKRLNEKYLTVQMYNSSSGGCSNTYGNLVLLNLEKLNYLIFPNYNLQQCYDINEDSTIIRESECTTTFFLKNNYLKISSTKKPNDGLNCMTSAEFKIKDNKLIKTKYYSYSKLKPVICIENICTGENFSFLKQDFSDAAVYKVPLYKYGYDTEEMGFEFSKKGQPQFCIAVSNNLVTGISFVSPNYAFKGISTGTTISEVLEKYPESKLQIDLINHWEYIYLKKNKIKFIFKTDKSNRIGIYNNEPLKGTTEIKRKNAEIDFVQI